jgi:hypothetical protein
MRERLCAASSSSRSPEVSSALKVITTERQYFNYLQCLFADPFTSFRGTARFKQNLSNFSKFTCAPCAGDSCNRYEPPVPHAHFMYHTSARSRWRKEGLMCREDVKCDVTNWEELDDLKLKVSWRFSCILNLPWKPLLAAAGAIAVQPAMNFMLCSIILV